MVQQERKAGKPTVVAEILQKILPQFVGTNPPQAWQLHQAWVKIMGTTIGRHSKPLRINGSVLWVLVDDSVWMQELSLLKVGLKKTVNDFLGQEIIQEIRFRLNIQQP